VEAVVETKEAYGIEELAKVGPWGRTYLFQAIKEKRLIAQKAWRTIITHENDQAFLRSLPVSEGKERAREHPPAAAPTPASGGLLETLGNPCDGRGWADASGTAPARSADTYGGATGCSATPILLWRPSL
jgi:hypothetical protein